MCNNFWENIYRTLVYVRLDIYNSNNVELVKILSYCISENVPNAEMVEKIIEINPALKQQLIIQNDKSYCLNTKAKDYVLCVLRIIKNLLEEKEYGLAYDVVDVLHIFPHVVIANKRRQIRIYCKVYVKPMIKSEIGKDYGLKLFKSCKE